MKHIVCAAVAAAACAAAFAQAPAGTTARPPQQTNPTASGGPAAATAEAKKGVTATAGASAGGWRTMDTNRDGMVSRAEWDAYHSGAWGKFKLNNGMASMADVEAAMKGGPN